MNNTDNTTDTNSSPKVYQKIAFFFLWIAVTIGLVVGAFFWGRKKIESNEDLAIQEFPSLENKEEIEGLKNKLKELEAYKKKWNEINIANQELKSIREGLKEILGKIDTFSERIQKLQEENLNLPKNNSPVSNPTSPATNNKNPNSPSPSQNPTPNNPPASNQNKLEVEVKWNGSSFLEEDHWLFIPLSGQQRFYIAKKHPLFKGKELKTSKLTFKLSFLEEDARKVNSSSNDFFLDEDNDKFELIPTAEWLDANEIKENPNQEKIVAEAKVSGVGEEDFVFCNSSYNEEDENSELTKWIINKEHSLIKTFKTTLENECRKTFKERRIWTISYSRYDGHEESENGKENTYRFSKDNDSLRIVEKV